MVTPAVVKQRLKLADVSPKLHEIYAEDGMTLDQLMAFSVDIEPVWGLNFSFASPTRRIFSPASSPPGGPGRLLSSSPPYGCCISGRAVPTPAQTGARWGWVWQITARTRCWKGRGGAYELNS